MRIVNYDDGTKLTLGGWWWQYDKYQDAARTVGVFSRGEGNDMVAGFFNGGENTTKVMTKFQGLPPEKILDVGRAVCRALYDVRIEGGL